MRYLKIALSVAFVVTVSFFAGRALMHRVAPQKAVERPVSPSRPKRPAPAEPSRQAKPAKVPTSSVRFEAPMMAIILDDWGENYELLKRAQALKRPIMIAVLPHLKYSARIAKEASQSGLGVMLHMPMQPLNSKQPSEPETIEVETSGREIRRMLKHALDSVPTAEGVNNHQGSAATSDERVMREVMAYLSERELFFVDSNVIATTVGSKVAAQTGIPFVKRDVFIDNDPKLESVKLQLMKAKKLALDRGRVVVIGHDKKNTIDAIEEMIPEFEKAGIEIVHVRRLLQ